MLNIIRFVISKYLYFKRLVWSAKVRLTAKSTGKNIYVGGPSSVNNKTVLGEHCSTNGLTVRGGGSVSIGDYVHTGNDLLIISSNHNYKNATLLPYDKQNENKNIAIGKAVWIGDRVTILGGVSIGEGAIIQAGSVVVSNIPAFAIVGGNPAKVFKYRDREHYVNLAKEERFLKV
jgi:acetyltransferase-like isoleucine patch superfamily enzyme